VSGEGRGSDFTQLDWSRRQFIEKLGIDPYPGTLNLVVDDADSLDAWDELRGMPGTSIENPGGGASRSARERICFISVESRWPNGT
jgi:CTP-dependent riboflavin kinase